MTVFGSKPAGPQQLRLSRTEALADGPMWVASVVQPEVVFAWEFGPIGTINHTLGEAIHADSMTAAVQAVMNCYASSGASGREAAGWPDKRSTDRPGVGQTHTNSPEERN